MIALSVVSSFYTSDAAETEVASYILTGMNQDKLDIKVKFSQPNKISQSQSDLDGLEIRFIDSIIFRAQDDGQQLTQDLSFEERI